MFWAPASRLRVHSAPREFYKSDPELLKHLQTLGTTVPSGVGQENVSGAPQVSFALGTQIFTANMFHPGRDGALFLERTLIPLQNFWEFVCASPKKTHGGWYILDKSLCKKRGSGTEDVLSLCSACRTSREFRGSSVRGSWAFSLLGLSVSCSS